MQLGCDATEIGSYLDRMLSFHGKWRKKIRTVIIYVNNHHDSCNTCNRKCFICYCIYIYLTAG